MRSSLLAEARANAADAGLNLFGLVDTARFDAYQAKEQRVAAFAPACGTILVLASGGRRLSEQFQRARAASIAEVTPSSFARAGAMRVAELLCANGIACAFVDLDRGTRLSRGALAEAAGFGTVSPVSGLLLHPEFGPWLRVRAAILVEGMPFGAIADASIADGFRPCCTCSRPCLDACPAAVLDGMGHQDLVRCADHRQGGGCESGCGSRMACPLGGEHRDAALPLVVHSHTHDLRAMRRWLGRGAWRFVPSFLRGRR